MKKNSISAAIKKLQAVVLVLERALDTVEAGTVRKDAKQKRPGKIARRGRPPKTAARRAAPPKVRKSRGPGQGRPLTTGRFQTRRDLETFVWGRYDTPKHRIAEQAGVSLATVTKILSRPLSTSRPADLPPAAEVIELPAAAQ